MALWTNDGRLIISFEDPFNLEPVSMDLGIVSPKEKAQLIDEWTRRFQQLHMDVAMQVDYAGMEED